ncbi:MAG: excinuclease ABC subunit UvrA [bacterium]|jgi:excinuclease ABC subunit A
MSGNHIVVKGAREHNLKSIDVRIPRDRITVITGLSGSGKSSLAFDTIYAEGQRRYVESLSTYARQFLGQMEKPDVDYIEGLSPAISIEQRTAGTNPRSTVGTITEVYDYMRLLYARAGVPHCPGCGKEISRQTPEAMVDRLLELEDGTTVYIMAPLVRGRKGHHRALIEKARKQGFVRARVDGRIVDLDRRIDLERHKKHTIEVVVDRLKMAPDLRWRLTDSIETALKVGEGVVNARVGRNREIVMSRLFACIDCGISFPEISPRMFSFNSPYGACRTCDGMGTRLEIDPSLIVPDDSVSLREGAVTPWGKKRDSLTWSMIETVAERYCIDMDRPFKNLKKAQQKVLLYGTGDQEIEFSLKHSATRRSYEYVSAFEGVIPNLERRFVETSSDDMRGWIGRYMSMKPCPECHGARLRPESLAVKVGGRSIAEATALSVRAGIEFFGGLSFTGRMKKIATPILKEIQDRLRFMGDVGLSYLTLDRQASTLAGGESQRIRLATQIGSSLVGVLYVLDEPSIGLHMRDNRRLLDTLRRLRDMGNTVVVVEHDRETIMAADYVIDLGPGAGKDGGRVVAVGNPGRIMKTSNSLTGQYLKGARSIPTPGTRRAGSGERIVIRGARQHNLDNIDVDIELGTFTCITGVSGSGKSTLVNEILYRALARHFYSAKQVPGEHDAIDGIEHIDKVIDIDQSPIGRTPRSNPATYTGAFTPIREVFSQVPEARMRGYQPGRFSFNVKGGRCEACRGDGVIKIEMHFLPDVYVRCDVCKGKRYERETLEIRYRGKNIADVLSMTVAEAREFFENIPAIEKKLDTLYAVGLGYIELGQRATTLSGGEAQRVKLSKELSKTSTGKTLYILDEPTTGLHFEDTLQLLNVLNRLVEMGNTVVVIEHNPDCIKFADRIVDLGPEGGDGGGRVVARGTPEEVARQEGSYTGAVLRQIFDDESKTYRLDKRRAAG